MIINDTEVTHKILMRGVVLKVNPVLNGTEIVAKVDEASRLDAGEGNPAHQLCF